MRTVLRIGLVAAVMATSWAASVPSHAAAPHQNLHGTFRETADGARLGYDIAGSAKLKVAAARSAAKVNISGLDPAKHYASHLHNQSCSTGGGGHYQNVEGGATTPPNELWLSSSDNALGTLDPNRGGVAHGDGSAPWRARLTSATQSNARSIVVHEPGTGARIACADLS